jgi:uncharacterized protein (TIGR03086 family)
MSDVATRYARLSGAFAAKVAAVSPERWGSPSPCEDWTARDVVRHVVTTQGMFLKLVGHEPPALPPVDDDPVSAWDVARAAIQAGLEDPAIAQAEYDGLLGRSTFESAVDRFLCTDLVVHGWDLARAAGLDDRIDPEEIERVCRDAEAAGDLLRAPGGFGPPVEPPPGADQQAQLLAFLGRRA